MLEGLRMNPCARAWAFCVKLKWNECSFNRVHMYIAVASRVSCILRFMHEKCATTNFRCDTKDARSVFLRLACTTVPLLLCFGCVFFSLILSACLFLGRLNIFCVPVTYLMMALSLFIQIFQLFRIFRFLASSSYAHKHIHIIHRSHSSLPALLSISSLSLLAYFPYTWAWASAHTEKIYNRIFETRLNGFTWKYMINSLSLSLSTPPPWLHLCHTNTIRCAFF